MLDVLFSYCSYWTGRASKKGVELLKFYQKELSSIPWKYKTYASVGFCYGSRDRSPFAQLRGPPTPDSSLSLRSAICHLTVFLRVSGEPLQTVSRLQADSVNANLFLNQGVMEIVKIELMSLELLFGSSPKSLLCVTAGNDSGGEDDSGDDLIPLLSLANKELHIALPCTKVWLHLIAWSKVISAVASLVTSSPAAHANATSVSSSEQHLMHNDGQSSPAHSPFGLGRKSLKSGREILSDGEIFDGIEVAVDKDVELVSTPAGGPPETLEDKSWPIQLKFGVLNVVIILPDYVLEAKPDHDHLALKWKQTSPPLVWTRSGNTIDDIKGGNKVEETQDGQKTFGKQILLTWSVRIDEIQANRDGVCNVSACIIHAEAAVEENFGEGQSFHMRFLQATDIGIKGKISVELGLKNAAFAIEVDSVDAWCSYNILYFLNRFHFEPVKTTSPSSATELYCSLDIRLHSCSLLLSDSRVSSC